MFFVVYFTNRDKHVSNCRKKQVGKCVGKKVFPQQKKHPNFRTPNTCEPTNTGVLFFFDPKLGAGYLI